MRKSNEALQREIHERTQAAGRVEALNEKLRLQTVKLEAVNKELETFGYSVSHDLRAPLRHIDGYVNVLREKSSELGEDGVRCINVISDSATQMGMLIDNLLAFSRMGRSAMQFEWVDTAAMVNQVREELAPDMVGRTIEWKVETLPKVYVDKALFKQVWMNLLGNAIKYTRNREKAEISIGCKETSDEFRVLYQGQWRRFRHEICEQAVWHLSTAPTSRKNSKAPASGWPMYSALLRGMADSPVLKAKSTSAQPSI